MKKSLLPLLLTTIVSTNVLAVTPTCEYIEKEAKYYGTSPLNGLELIANNQDAVNPTKLTFTEHFNQAVRIENYQHVRMYDYEEENDVFSFVTAEKRKSGFYKGQVLRVELTKISETEYDVMFRTDKSYKGKPGNKVVVWSNDHHKHILRDRSLDPTKPIRYTVTPESLKKVKTFKCKSKK